MSIGKLFKETDDIHRVQISFASWIDPAETVSVVSGPSVDVIYHAVAGQEAIADLTTLAVADPTIVGGTTVQMMVSAGTPGLLYLVTFIAEGSSSGRRKTVRFNVAVKVLPDGINTVTIDTVPQIFADFFPTSLPSIPNVVWNNGGVLCIS